MRADAEEKVAAPRRRVGVPGAGSADAAEREPVPLRKGALAGGRGGDGNTADLREPQKFVVSARVMNAAADHDHRPLCRGKQFDRLRCTFRVGAGGRALI